MLTAEDFTLELLVEPLNGAAERVLSRRYYTSLVTMGEDEFVELQYALRDLRVQRPCRSDMTRQEHTNWRDGRLASFHAQRCHLEMPMQNVSFLGVEYASRRWSTAKPVAVIDYRHIMAERGFDDERQHRPNPSHDALRQLCRPSLPLFFVEYWVVGRDAQPREDWAGQWLSLRHREWGPALKMTDIDHLIVNPSTSAPKRMMEYKGENAPPVRDSDDPIVALGGACRATKLPLFIVRYTRDFYRFDVTAANKPARNSVKPSDHNGKGKWTQTMDQSGYITWMTMQ